MVFPTLMAYSFPSTELLCNACVDRERGAHCKQNSFAILEQHVSKDDSYHFGVRARTNDSLPHVLIDHFPATIILWSVKRWLGHKKKVRFLCFLIRKPRKATQLRSHSHSHAKLQHERFSSPGEVVRPNHCYCQPELHLRRFLAFGMNAIVAVTRNQQASLTGHVKTSPQNHPVRNPVRTVMLTRDTLERGNVGNSCS